MDHIPRIIDKCLTDALKTSSAVLLYGPEGCGKTTAAKRVCAAVLPDSKKRTAASYPLPLQQGRKPLLIDEWQTAPALWNAVISEADRQDKTGLFVLTGSSIPSRITPSRRIKILRMHPMSLYESGDSNGAVSLKELFNDPSYDIDGAVSDLTFKELAYCACRGGWPESLTSSDALSTAKEFLTRLCEESLSSVDGHRRTAARARAILTSCAANISKPNTALLEYIRNNNASFPLISHTSWYSYFDALKVLFIIEEIPPWMPGIRPITALCKSFRKIFPDPSLMAAALDLFPELLLTDPAAFSSLFHTLCFRDLRAYAPYAETLQYRDRLGLRADCVLRAPDGRYALIRFGLRRRQADEGCAHLVKLSALIKKHDKVRPPDLLLVLTGGDKAYRTEDGVCVVPVGCLKD